MICSILTDLKDLRVPYEDRSCWTGLKRAELALELATPVVKAEVEGAVYGEEVDLNLSS